ncbi:MAG: 16S rRNA (guanine(527)-N(7))-methyltransferase RsmG [Candidatus Acidiferrales bacterium]
MGEIPCQLIQDELSPYGIAPDEVQCRSINSYISLLLRWNLQVSLTTVTDPIEVLRFHFGESLYATVCVPILNGRLADVGSGAGFPALPLRLFSPDLALIMIESNAKKAAFLREVIRQLGFSGAEVIRERMEKVPESADPFDFITARALGNHAGLLEWSRKQLAASGRLVLWLGEEDVAKISTDKRWKWQDPAHIPGSKRRFVLSGLPYSR